MSVFALALAVSLFAVGMHGVVAWLERDPQRFAGWLETVIGQPLAIDRLDTVWTGIDLRIRLEGAALLSADRSHRLMSFERLSLTLAGWRSLWNLGPRIEAVRAEGAVLGVRRHKDGHLEIAGLEHVAAETDAATPEWLQSLPDVTLRDCRVVWFDDLRRPGLPPLYFRDAQLSLRNQPGRHRLRMQAALPEGFGNVLRVQAEIHGDLFDGRWSGSGRIATAGLNLPAWFGERRFLGLRSREGQADLEARVVWEQARPVSVEGRLAVRDLDLVPRTGAKPYTGPRGVQGAFQWRKNETGWRLELPEAQIQGQGKTRRSRLNIHAQGTEPEIHVETGPLEIRDLIEPALVGDWLPEPAYAALSGLRPQARLEGLRLRIWDGGFLLDVDFDRLHTRPWRDIPGLVGVSGHLRASHEDGRLRLTGQDASLDFADLFPRPLEIEALEGEILWRRVGDAWRIDTLAPLKARNPDIAFQARLSGEFTADGQSNLDLRARFRDGVAASIARYLPAPPVMTEDAVAWLGQAFRGGKLPQGGLLLRGDPQNFPFANGKGRFETRFDVEDVHLRYAVDWPEITGGAGHAAFIDQGMRITVDRGKLYSGSLERAEVSIPDLNRSVLTVRARTRAPAADMQRFVYESPLDEQIGDGLRRLEMRGDAGLDLHLVLPFDTMRTDVRGRVRFDGGAVTVLEPRFEFTRVTGEAQFDREGLHAKAIQARLRGRDTTIRLGRGTLPGDRPALRVDVTGRMDVRRIVGAEIPVLEQLVRGEPLWRVNVLVETQTPTGRARETQVRVASDLQGAEIALPEPLYKPADVIVPFQLNARVDGENLGPLRFYLGRDLRGVLELVPDENQGLVLSRGEIRYRQGAAERPEGSGLTLRADVEKTALADWLALIDRLPVGDDGPGIARIEARTDALDAYGRIIRDLRLEATPQEDHWRLDVAGPTLAGRIRVPSAPGGPQPVHIELTRLILDAAEDGSARSETDPRDFPPTQIRVEDFRFSGKSLGRLRMDLRPHEAGLKIHALELDNPDSSLRVSGDWRLRDAGQRSVFEIDLESRDLRATLARWQLDTEVDAEKMRGRLSAHWDAAPRDFDWDILQGNMTLQVGAGRLLDVDPGLARLLGLLSIPGLSRRVQGDFSDLTGEGFAFDEIAGGFRFDAGRANTEDLLMAGPAAKIEVRGDLDLARERYALDVFVTPKLSATLPVATTLLGGTGVGAVVFLVQQVVGDELDQIARQKFVVTGPWSDPLVDGKTAAQRQAEEAAQAEAQKLRGQDDF